MINTTSRSQKIRNAIAALLTAASTLIAAEAGAMYGGEGEKEQNTTLHQKALFALDSHIGEWQYKIIKNNWTNEEFEKTLIQIKMLKVLSEEKEEESIAQILDNIINIDRTHTTKSNEILENCTLFSKFLKERYVLNDKSQECLFIRFLSLRLLRYITY